MDFFEAQDQARRKTFLLVAYFVFAVLLMILAIYVVAVLALAWPGKEVEDRSINWIRPDLLLVVSMATVIVIALGSLYKIAEMRAGGSAVALMLGGRRIQPTTTDVEERRVLNVVEEMAIASGVAVPPVFLLKNEANINAFAAGYTPDDAVIGVSQGSLDYLSRDELQGVIAHEFSHILNGDMRFNLRLIGVLHGIMLISLIGYFMLRANGGGRSRNRNEGGGQIMLIGLAAFVIGYLGLFFGRLIKSAVSRQREFLADASAVQFTRNPDSIAGALKKIGGRPEHAVIKSPNAETASHLFFGDAFRRWAHSPFATHPPLEQRIRRLDPHFDGNYPKVQRLREPPQKSKVLKSTTEETRSPLGMILAGVGMADQVPLDPAVVIASVGAPTSQHMDYSHELLESIPESLQVAIREVFTARAIIFAMLLDADAEIRSKQLELLKTREGEATLAEVRKFGAQVGQIPAPARLPTLEVIQGSLRDLSPSQYEHFRETVEQLVKADRKISLFEFVLQRVVIKHLDRVFELSKPPAVRYHSVRGVLPSAEVLVSALAHLGHADDEVSERIYGDAMRRLDDKTPHQILSKSDCGLDKINHSLNQISECSAAVKKRVLTTAALCVAADQKVTVMEAELLRAMASAIDCPIPPILAGEIQKQSGS
ncbi:MAG: M48 family metallopeptidase [Pirellulaceae bacterium]|nr:M48 family metallopeptidase [Pirellulaceae bacterium]